MKLSSCCGADYLTSSSFKERAEYYVCVNCGEICHLKEEEENLK